MATQAEVGIHIDLSDRQVRNLVKEGVLPAGQGPGGLNLEACRLAYIRHLRGKVTGQVARPTANLDQHSERARLTHHQANIAEMEERRLQGSLVPESEVVEWAQQMIAAAKSRLLSIPTKAAPEVALQDDTNTIKTTLTDLVYEALNELATWTPVVEEGSGDDVGATTVEDGQRMGGSRAAVK